jgi:hypothetical protein
MYGVENRTTVPIEVTLNIGKSKNCSFNTANTVIKKEILPNRIETFVHVRRTKINEPMHFDYDLKYKVINQ